MKTSARGINLIKKYEGCRLTAYKAIPSEKYYTIGWGRYSPDIKPGQTITQAQADAMLAEDLVKYERAVDSLGNWTQNQHDALVSFAYNCGTGNVQKLCKGRTPQQIADCIPLYNKAGGKVLAGLTRRRNEERALFLEGGAAAPATGNPYSVPDKTLKRGSRGNGVRWLQYELNRRGFGLVVDGIFGQKTEDAVRAYQNQRNLISDGIVGARTRAELQNT